MLQAWPSAPAMLFRDLHKAMCAACLDPSQMAQACQCCWTTAVPAWQAYTSPQGLVTCMVWLGQLELDSPRINAIGLQGSPSAGRLPQSAVLGHAAGLGSIHCGVSGCLPAVHGCLAPVWTRAAMSHSACLAGHGTAGELSQLGPDDDESWSASAFWPLSSLHEQCLHFSLVCLSAVWGDGLKACQ